MESEWIRWIGTAILGWIAWEMRALRKDVEHRVPFSECNRRMDVHGEKLTELDQRVRTHGHQLAAIEECHNRLNPDAKLSTKRKRRNKDDETEDFN